jgi:hypothetical protein
MSTVFHFHPGETEKRSEVGFGFGSCFGRLGCENVCTNFPFGIQPVCQHRRRWRLESEQRTPDSAVSSNCRAVVCAILSAERSAGDSGRYRRSSTCKPRGVPRISRRRITSRKLDFDASNVAIFALKSAVVRTPEAFGAA